MYPFVMLLVIGVAGYLVYLALKEEVVKEGMERKMGDFKVRQSTEELKAELKKKMEEMRGKDGKG